MLPTLWADFNQIAHTVPDTLPNGRGFEICEACSDGNTLYNMNHEILFSEVAGIEVSSFDHLTAPFTKKILRGGRYAVFTHRQY